MVIMEKTLSPKQAEDLMKILKTRFDNNSGRHKNADWTIVQRRLESDPVKLWSLMEMESTGGEPDVTGYNPATGEVIFTDCSEESPKGRRSLCYDDEALRSRKENAPRNSALEMASAMGIEILTEQQYRELQKLGKFDMKTSSWIKTPPDIRKLGGALYCDFRFGHVFVYHNGADSYYAARGFRGELRV